MDLNLQIPDNEHRSLTDRRVKKLSNIKTNLSYLRSNHNNMLTNLSNKHLEKLRTVLFEIMDAIIKCDREKINIDFSFLDSVCADSLVADINLTSLNQMLEEYLKFLKGKNLSNEIIMAKRAELSDCLPETLKPFTNQLFPYYCYYKIDFFSDKIRFYLNYRIELFDFEGALRTTNLNFTNVDYEIDAIPFAYAHIGGIIPRIPIDDKNKIKLLIINGGKARIHPMSNYSDMNQFGYITTIEYNNYSSYFDNEGIEMFYSTEDNQNKKLNWAFSPRAIISKDIRNSTFYYNLLKNLSSQITLNLLHQYTEILEEIKRQISLATDENTGEKSKQKVKSVNESKLNGEKE